MELKRQVFEAFCLQITYDKPNRRIEISATLTEAIAETLENERDLPEDVSNVARIMQGYRSLPELFPAAGWRCPPRRGPAPAPRERSKLMHGRQTAA